MIPLRDEQRPRNFPWVTLLIIFVNLGVFAYQLFFGPRTYGAYIDAFGLVPYTFTHHIESQGFKIITAMFMHGGFLHILSNMWFLWIFGDNIEDALGRFRYLLFYLVTGALSFVAHIAMDPSSKLPLVGASGAIAGVLGGYLLLFPLNRILTLVPIFFFVTTVHVPAAFYLVLWFLMQVVNSKVPGGMGASVAWWAHIGGFVSGFVLVKMFQRRRS